MKYILSVSVAIMVVLFTFGLYQGPVQTVEGAGVSNTVANIATSSTITVGPQQIKTIFTAKNFCGSRMIGTLSQPVNIAYGGGINLATTSMPVIPSLLVGFPLSASTTNTYTSANHGCTTVYAYAAASTTITIAEFIQ